MKDSEKPTHSIDFIGLVIVAKAFSRGNLGVVRTPEEQLNSPKIAAILDLSGCMFFSEIFVVNLGYTYYLKLLILS